MSSVALLRLRLGAAEVAVPLERVDEILRMVALEPVPGAGATVRGAMNLRGEIVVVLDFAPLLTQPAVADDPSHYIVVVRGGSGRYAFLCNDTIGVAEPDDTQRRELSASSAAAPVREVVHVDGRLIPLLDPEVLFARAS